MTHLRSSWNIWRPNPLSTRHDETLQFLTSHAEQVEICGGWGLWRRCDSLMSWGWAPNVAAAKLAMPKSRTSVSPLSFKIWRGWSTSSRVFKPTVYQMYRDSVWWTFQVCRWVLASSFIARPAMSCCEGRWRCQHSYFWVRQKNGLLGKCCGFHDERWFIHINWRNVSVYIYIYACVYIYICIWSYN